MAGVNRQIEAALNTLKSGNPEEIEREKRCQREKR